MYSVALVLYASLFCTWLATSGTRVMQGHLNSHRKHHARYIKEEPCFPLFLLFLGLILACVEKLAGGCGALGFALP